MKAELLLPLYQNMCKILTSQFISSFSKEQKSDVSATAFIYD
jgi:hypothetical protein